MHIAVAAVLHCRIGKQIDLEHLVPLLEGRFADEVPPVDDTAEQRFLSQTTAAMDGQVDRLGPLVAESRPLWVLETFDEVPEYPQERLRGSTRPGRVEKYREGSWDHPTEPIGPEPAMATPEKRSAYYADLEQVDADYREWEHATGHILARAVAADAEIRPGARPGAAAAAHR